MANQSDDRGVLDYPYVNYLTGDFWDAQYMLCQITHIKAGKCPTEWGKCFLT